MQLLIYPFDDGAAVGRILARSQTRDVSLDAHLVALGIRLDEPILTGDLKDLRGDRQVSSGISGRASFRGRLPKARRPCQEFARLLDRSQPIG